MPGKLNITQYHKGDGTLNPNLQTIFRDARILIFVIDPMEEHNHALENLHNLITVSRLVSYLHSFKMKHNNNMFNNS